MKQSTIILLIALSLSGCGFRNTMKHWKSSTIGLHRKITLYAANGNVIREWDVRSKVEDNGGTCYFITNNNKAITIAGTFVIEEE